MLNASIIGIQFPVAIAIGYFFGRQLDFWFNTKPWLTAVFSLFGIIAGFINLFQLSATATEHEKREAQIADNKDDDSENGGD